MGQVEDPRDNQEKRNRYEENVPSSKILKLAILAALIIVVIALVLYLKARHQPPALRNQLQVSPTQLKAQMDRPRVSPKSVALPVMNFQEVLWTPPQTASQKLS